MKKIIYNTTPGKSAVRALPSREAVAARAEALWREKGCPEGCDVEIWLEAEAQLANPLRKRVKGTNFGFLDRGPSLDRMSDKGIAELDNLFPGAGGPGTTSL